MTRIHIPHIIGKINGGGTKMTFKHGRKTYRADRVKAKGFSLRMGYKELEVFLHTQTAEERNDLFHHIYDHYTYAGSCINEYGCKGSNLNPSDFYKIMAKLKRYEKYLYIILKS